MSEPVHAAPARAGQRQHDLRIRYRKGLDIPLAGAPAQVIERARPPRNVAVLGDDYVGLRPRLLVGEGDRVRMGDPLLADRRDPRIVCTAFGSGTVAAVNRGERRSLRSLVLSVDGGGAEAHFAMHSPAALRRLSRETVAENLLRSGMWTALRSRPFGCVPLPDTMPRAVFVTAIDTNPLAAQPELVIGERRRDFANGLTILGRLTDGPVYLCTGPGADIDDDGHGRITRAVFSGPHPSGLVGTHIHALSPAGPGREVWHIGYQDVIAIGRLFTTGRLSTERVVALGGPAVRRPRLLRTRLGADLSELTAGEVSAGGVRVVSGSVLSGRRAGPAVGYLGRYHAQVSVLREPAADDSGRPPAFSAVGLGRVLRRRVLALNTALHGRPEAMLPVGAFERVMPLDVLPVPLLKALAVGDTERALELGCLELEEEDLALCAFVCPSKLDYGTLLRRTLTQLEKEL